MFAAAGRFSVRHRLPIILFWILAIAFSLPALPRLASSMQAGGFISGGTESQRALDVIHNRLGISFSSVQVFFSSDTLRADSPEFSAAVATSLQGVRSWDAVTSIVTPDQNPAQISKDGRAAFAVLFLKDGIETSPKFVDELNSRLEGAPDLHITLGGGPVFYEDIQLVSQEDLKRAEIVAFPFALLALLLVFRTPVAAALPALVGGTAAAVALALIAIIAGFMPLSIFVLNTATLIGLGLGVDYSLFMVSRYREELQLSSDVAGAVERTVATAGRAVFFSGLTVAIGLGSMMFFQFNLLQSVGVGGLLVVLLAVVTALTLLPSVLSLLGHNINRFQIGSPVHRRSGGPGFWKLLADFVMDRPIPVAAVCIVLLAVLGSPFMRVKLGVPDASILPPSVPSRAAFELLNDRFEASETSPILISVQSEHGKILDSDNVEALYRYVRRIEADPRVERVDSIVSLDPRFTLGQYQLMYANPERTGDAFVQQAVQKLASGDTTLIRVVSKFQMTDVRSTDLVGALRNDRPDGFVTLVSGGSAGVVDYVNTLYHDFPLAVLGIMASTYLVLLFLLRSVLLPLKAIAMNMLSILVSYGALVFVFQEGHFANLLGFKGLGFVEASIPIIMFCTLFGLSMDYEVFLLSRVQEAYEQTGNNRESVSLGLQRSGRIVTSAALIVIAVSLSFLAADMILVKSLGLGMALAVLVDATLIRGLLVPATMRMLGRWNWWLPSGLDRILPRLSPEHMLPPLQPRETV